MKMKVVCMIVMLVVMVDVVSIAEAVNCNPLALSPCLGAITSNSPPSANCCSKLKEQTPCLCGYLKNPNLRQYVNSPGSKQVASTCGVTIPKC
ncbi:non-specific lipid-transfer protein 2 [Cicer arietinum]|uniref:Non-specific lipid-transfer protein 2 n=1 Tax=Cicer arietinum TaxID=3827 RepID=A0A3Q7XWW7_CICAR|nr:non-specific lipid-transfer protein 2 [Cicer arietinum]